MLRCALRARPLLQHFPFHRVELLELLFVLRIAASKLNSVAVRVEEIVGVEDTVIRYT